MQIQSNSIEKPKILYKYRYFDKYNYHLDSLINNSLWFSSGKHFNDPFDLGLQYKFDGNKKLKMNWAYDFLNRYHPELSRKERRILARNRIKEIENDPNHIEWFRENFAERIHDSFGVCSLTPHRDNLLMWSHYSHYHTGFCIGLDTDKLFEFQKSQLTSPHNNLIELHKVEYASTMPQINFFEAMIEQDHRDTITPLITTKSHHWSYEDEYRLIFWHKTDQLVPLQKNSIIEIVLGCRIEKVNSDKILAALRQNNLNISVIQAKKHSSKFELVFESLL